MNQNYKIENNIAQIKINKNIYSKEVIMQTTYVLLDKYYFFIDMEENNFIIEIRGRENMKILNKDILIFYDELIESSAYIDQLKRTSKTRELILEKALMSQNKKQDK